MGICPLPSTYQLGWGRVGFACQLRCHSTLVSVLVAPLKRQSRGIALSLG